MEKSVFITGTSSGIGKALAEKYVRLGWHVYGLSRRPTAIDALSYRHRECDLTQLADIGTGLDTLLAGVMQLDLVILNAGVLGKVKTLATTPIDDLQQLMTINMWANKVVLDWLFAELNNVKQVVAMSSGAAVNGNRGWGGYSLSKAALNMLIKLYATEQANCHLTALAPGLVDTAIQDYLCGNTIDSSVFPSVNTLRAARGTERMPTPSAFAETAIPIFAELLKHPSGAFVDVRTM